MPRLLRVVGVSLVLAFLLSASTSYAAVGRITGTITDAADGKPLAYASVLVVGTSMGAFAREGGKFNIENVPVGTYTVKATMMGYEAALKENVTVAANQPTEVDFQLKSTVAVTFNPVEVEAERPMVDTQKTQTNRTVSTEDVKVRSINTVQEAIATQAGVVLEQGQLHVRGGRSNEVKYFSDGLQISDPFVGGNEVGVSLASLSEIEVLSGGFEAEYGNVQSGVINLKTKEGGTKYSGVVKYMTDDFGAPDKTYFNSDDLALGFGGPLLTTNLRFFTSGEVNFSDTYLKTLEPRQAKKIWGIKFRARQNDQYSGQTKITYKFSEMKKISTELLTSGDKYDFYHHGMSRVGYWSRENKQWWFEPLDSTYTLYIAPAHTPDISNSSRQIKMVWNHTLSSSAFYTLRLGRYTTLHTEDVLGKQPYQYDPYVANNDLDPANKYYVVSGDYPHWQRYNTTMWTAKGDMVLQKTATHQVKFGAESNLYNLHMKDLTYPSLLYPLGQLHDIYTFHTWGMSAFGQDRIKFEGMNLSVGLRLDMFDPGQDAIAAYNKFLSEIGASTKDNVFLNRTKWQLSPRFGVSYPISERDALYFNYGRFYMVPRLEVLLQAIGGVENSGGPYGNPTIDAETTIMYEVGVQHQFSNTVVGDVAMFYKDIFGLTGTQLVQAADSSYWRRVVSATGDPVIYTNLDYGSVRGIELKLSKRFSHRFSGGVTYTFSQATGSSSSELQGQTVASQGLDRAPITELPLDWDRNHVISANLYFSEPGLWGCNVDWSYSSGAPYTPVQPRERFQKASLINSKRLPARTTVDVKADKKYKIAGQEISLFLEGNNILNRRNLATLNPGNWPGGNGNYIAYYTTQHRVGGAYDQGELLGLPDVIYVPLNDPRVYSPPRSFQVGVSFDW
ncbi:MAG TPA: TonB-dependent receptor [bacterium]|nr:TonB-dependent receptor [bacterium]